MNRRALHAALRSEHAPSGDDLARAADLVPQLYAQLRRYARMALEHDAPGTLQPTALVHEAFLRLLHGDQQWDSPAHFLGAAARSMRRILVDRARRRTRLSHGGERRREEMTSEVLARSQPDETLMALDEALREFEAADQRRSEVVHLRHFAGLSLEETAQTLGISLSTVKADWTFARAWLKRWLERGEDRDGG